MPEDKTYHLSPSDFRRLGHAAIDWVADYYERVESLPVLSPSNRATSGRRCRPIRPNGASDSKTSWRTSTVILPGITHWQSPHFFAYFPANASGPSILGDLVSGVRDGGGGGCGVGQHTCGGGCIDDLPNDSTRGCRFGCGEPCPEPANATSTCTATGSCDFTCNAPFTRSGESCVCMPRSCTDLRLTCGPADNGCGMSIDCGRCTDGAMCLSGTCG